MAKRGAPLGNRNAFKGKAWTDAIRRALAKDKTALDRCAAALVKAAEGGDMAAIRELGDRLDGKPRQELDVAQTVVGRVSAEPMSVEEWAAQARESIAVN